MKKLLFVVILLITSCADISTLTRFPDGRIVESHLFALGMTDAVKGFKDEMTKDSRTISFDEAKSDVNVQALGAFSDIINKLFAGLVEGAVKGAK